MILVGKCEEVLRTLPENSVDAVVCDPPYELTSARPGGRSPATRGAVMKGFMGMEWDGSGIAYSPEMWREVLRVLKPGGHLLAFGGTRTQHRMVCAIEDAGFEIKTQLYWIFGQGMPKGKNDIKPAAEPICFARKPMSESTVAKNVLRWGTGALNIEDSRVATEENLNGGAYAKNGTKRNDGWGMQRGGAGEFHQPKGRWPANVIHDGSDEVVVAFPDAPGQLADASLSPDRRKTQNVYGTMRVGRGTEPSAGSENVGAVGFKMRPGMRRLDGGSAARFFYVAKASRSDRGEGNTHPTVKPVALMEYLVRLVTPSGGVVLDHFLGSGTTAVAAKRLGYDFVGIEQSEEYAAIAQRRVDAAKCEALGDLI